MARSRQLTVFAAITLFLIIYALQSSIRSKLIHTTLRIPAVTAPRPPQTIESEHRIAPPSPSAPAAYHPPQPIYKPIPPSKSLPPVVDNFPLAANAASAADLPPIPAWNVPPRKHVPEATPLFIGFTRNWLLLQQTVVGYITAGWPPGDIIVVENTGVMDSNKHGRLSMQNPFFLNHTRLHLLGVDVVIAPTLLTFAQLQNFFLFAAIEKDWPQYFWSHMDVLVLAHENLVLDGPALGAGPKEDVPHVSAAEEVLAKGKSAPVPSPEEVPAELEVKPPGKPDAQPPPSPAETSDRPRSHPPRAPKLMSLYMRAVEVLRETNADDWAPAKGREWDNSRGPPEHWAHKIHQPLAENQLTSKRWAARFFHYDHLALVQTKAYQEVGGWDTSIPYYKADCDMHERLLMRGFKITDADAGRIFDVGTSLDDLFVLYRKRSPDGSMKNASFLDVNAILDSKEPENFIIPDPPPFHALTRNSGRPEEWIDDAPNSPAFQRIIDVGEQMKASKANSKSGRNLWQSRQKGGEGEPFYTSPQDFETSMNMAIENGLHVFGEKWGHRDCDLLNAGLSEKDAWKVQHDWE